MKKLITKGTWYYEIQILMFVFMWRHTDYHPKSYIRKENHKLYIGRFLVWIDSAWTYHGIGGYIRDFHHDLTKNTKVFKRWQSKVNVIRINAKNMFKRWHSNLKIFNFFISLRNYLDLYRAGFWISRSRSIDGRLDINRFMWKDKIIKDMADIDRVDDYYDTVKNGHFEPLSSGVSEVIKTNFDGHDI